jgi:S1-C subfamily serine protease
MTMDHEAGTPTSNSDDNIDRMQGGRQDQMHDQTTPDQPASQEATPGYQPQQWQPQQASPTTPLRPSPSPASTAPDAVPDATPPQDSWPSYAPPPSYPTYPTYQPPQQPTAAPPPYQPYQPYQGYQPSYPPQYSYWVPAGAPQPQQSYTDRARRILASGQQHARFVFERVRTQPRWRSAAIALILLVMLVTGIGIGSALSHASATPPTTNVTIGANSAPIATVPAAAQDLQQTVITTVHAVEPSVVEVISGGGRNEAIGSGEILTKDGYVVTNDHVVQGFSSFSVRLNSGQTLSAQLIGQSAQDDLAVLKVSLANAQPIAFADSSAVQVGQFAIALGSPLGFQDSATFGIVSALNRSASEAPDGPAGELTGLIQTSAPINPGNSGGALVDLQGQLIGIPTLGATDSQTGGAANGIGFAIASNRVKYVSQQLIANGHLTSSGQGFLGIQGQDVSPNFGGNGQSGVQIAGFTNDASGHSPAQAAGLRIGDIITAVDGHAVVSGDELASALMTKQPGTQVTIQYTRGSSQNSVRVTLGERPVQSQG